MTDYVLIPGAGGTAWFWHRVVPLLHAAGHRAAAVDLPGDDPAAGLPEYVERVVAATRGEVVLAAQSMGAFTAYPAAEVLDVEHLFLLNAMIPEPGETAHDWWGNTGSEAARVAAARAGGYPEEMDLRTYFMHDVDPAIAAAGEPYQRNEAEIAFQSPCAFTRRPPTTVLAGRDDRFFPLGFQRRVARERLGQDVVEVPGGHLAALSHPEAIAEALLNGPQRSLRASRDAA
jgi:pimeloyl-ACP methyl ester carboxylesterase